jgi:hypothetical protein
MLNHHEIDQLLLRVAPLFAQAARGLVPASDVAELAGDIACQWWLEYRRRPLELLAVLDRHEAEIVRWATWRGRDLLRQQRTADGDMIRYDEITEADRVYEIEWGALNNRDAAPGARDIATVAYVADDSDLMRLFYSTARREAALIDAQDLAEVYRHASPKAQRAIRELASGFSYKEMGMWAYEQAQGILRRAVN